jgi:hypothetical protein
MKSSHRLRFNIVACIDSDSCVKPVPWGLGNVASPESLSDGVFPRVLHNCQLMRYLCCTAYYSIPRPLLSTRYCAYLDTNWTPYDADTCPSDSDSLSHDIFLSYGHLLLRPSCTQLISYHHTDVPEKTAISHIFHSSRGFHLGWYPHYHHCNTRPRWQVCQCHTSQRIQRQDSA